MPRWGSWIDRSESGGTARRKRAVVVPAGKRLSVPRCSWLEPSIVTRLR